MPDRYRRSSDCRYFGRLSNSSLENGVQTWSRPFRLLNPWCAVLWPTSHRLKAVIDGRNAIRPKMAFSLLLPVKLPWQASCPTRNSRTIAAVTTSVPASFSARLSAVTTSAELAANSATSNRKTAVGSSNGGVFSNAPSRALRFHGVACMRGAPRRSDGKTLRTTQMGAARSAPSYAKAARAGPLVLAPPAIELERPLAVETRVLPPQRS